MMPPAREELQSAAVTLTRTPGSNENGSWAAISVGCATHDADENE